MLSRQINDFPLKGNRKKLSQWPDLFGNNSGGSDPGMRYNNFRGNDNQQQNPGNQFNAGREGGSWRGGGRGGSNRGGGQGGFDNNQYQQQHESSNYPSDYQHQQGDYQPQQGDNDRNYQQGGNRGYNNPRGGSRGGGGHQVASLTICPLFIRISSFGWMEIFL